PDRGLIQRPAVRGDRLPFVPAEQLPHPGQQLLLSVQRVQRRRDRRRQGGWLHERDDREQRLRDELGPLPARSLRDRGQPLAAADRPGGATLTLSFRERAIDAGDGRALADAMRAEIASIYEGLDLDGDHMPAAGPAQLSP